MKKYFLLICLGFSLISNSQTIYPDFNSEYCPNQEITFTVTIPG